jgi:catechol 2,3-dioxygenase-like lactoylglutathione lyase family enzyme
MNVFCRAQRPVTAERATPAYTSNSKDAPMSRLEAFRKQAKQLVRWHRDGHYSVGGRIRGLSRYAHLTDAQALKLKFPLATAQEIIAHEAGFGSWSELKATIAAAPPTPQVPLAAPPGAQAGGAGPTPQSSRAGPPVIQAAIPVIFVASVPRTAEFFRDGLGFCVDFLHGHPPFYGGVSRDGVSVHLRFVHEPVICEELREKEGLLAAFVRVRNVKGLFGEYKTKGVSFASTLGKEPWGGPMFTVRDPDGNRICFCESGLT